MNLEFEHVVEDWKALPTGQNFGIKSAWLEPASHPGQKWRLEIYPDGYDMNTKGNISVFVQPSQLMSNEVTYTIAIRMDDSSWDLENKSAKKTFSDFYERAGLPHGGGWPIFLPRIKNATKMTFKVSLQYTLQGDQVVAAMGLLVDRLRRLQPIVDQLTDGGTIDTVVSRWTATKTSLSRYRDSWSSNALQDWLAVCPDDGEATERCW